MADRLFRDASIQGDLPLVRLPEKVSESAYLQIDENWDRGRFRVPHIVWAARVRLGHPEIGWRQLTELYNDGLRGKQVVSVSLLRQACNKLSFKSEHETSAKTRV